MTTSARERIDTSMYEGHVKSTWCRGCGDFGVLNALKGALARLAIPPHEVLVVSGIGCGSKLPDYMLAYGLLTLHGRPLPFATGAKLANPDLHVIVVDGDGDAYGIGGNHLIHTARRNPNITHIVENNQVYGLTKGQYSPTSDLGYVSTTSPQGSIEPPLSATALTFTAGAGFVARGFAGDPKALATLIAEAMEFPGYAHVDVLQPCVTFNKVNTYDWYRDRTESTPADPSELADRHAAWERVQEWGDRIPSGVLYRADPPRPAYEAQVAALQAGFHPVRGSAVHDPMDSRYEELKQSWFA
jgi:2-oxoglutarate ferredoxin oxidoreductase subunit beta